jgi:hypothetical protein
LKGKRHRSRGNCFIGLLYLRSFLSSGLHIIRGGYLQLFKVTICDILLSCRFTGTIVGCENLDPLWPDSSWRYLKVTSCLIFTITIVILTLVLMEDCFLFLGALG